MFVKVQCWRDFFTLADRKLGASFCLPSTSEGLQNLVERKLIVLGAGAVCLNLWFAVLTVALLAGSTQRQDLLLNDKTCL